MKTSRFYCQCLLFYFFCGFLGTTFGFIQEITINGSHHNKVVICHVEIWSVYRRDAGAFSIEEIDPSLCTHLVFGYTHLNETTDEIIIFESWSKLLGRKSHENISKLKAKKPDLKVLVSLGGWLDGSIKYSRLAANPKRVQRFVNNTLDFIEENSLDGMHLVWQYPGKRGGLTTDKENYIQLLKELKFAFKEFNYTLTACVGSSKDTIDYGYDIPKLSEILDYLLVYNYDYHGWWSRMTGANSGLTGPDFLNTEYSINYLLKLGANPHKLLLGIPLFGRSYILNDTKSFNENQPKFGQQFVGHGFEGPYTKEEGLLTYHEICLLFKNSSQNWTIFWDDESNTPIAVDEDRMISFDNEQAIILKVQFALNHGLGGFSAYAVDNDDFRGDCGIKYPLLGTIERELSTYRYKIDNDIDNNLSTGEIRSGSINYKSSLLMLLSVLFAAENFSFVIF
nr:probable chitinase 2 [Onthophagus taurus]XP_022913616.1 probable chitinase 2 [Onthophagus taurus]XP_022913621.1 probable chitinase 2 [Onthophagus taurus]